MSMMRQTAKIIENKLRAHASLRSQDVADLIRIGQHMINDPECDARTRSNLIKFLVQHDFDIIQYLKPPVAKSEITVCQPPISGKLEVKLINATGQTGNTKTA